MALTDTAIRGTKPGQKPFKVYDRDGLFLLVNLGGIPECRSCGVGAIASMAKKRSWNWASIRL